MFFHLCVFLCQVQGPYYDTKFPITYPDHASASSCPVRAYMTIICCFEFVPRLLLTVVIPHDVGVSLLLWFFFFPPEEDP